MLSKPTVFPVSGLKPPIPPVNTERHAYFERLASRPDVFKAHDLRTQAGIDAIPRGGGNDDPTSIRYPIYDPLNDAMLQRTKNGGNAVQKQPFLGVLRTSMFLTYDFKIGSGARWLNTSYLQQYKAYRIDWGSNAGIWLSIKTRFLWNPELAPTSDPRICRLMVTYPFFAAPGTTVGGSEELQPRLAIFYPRENVVSRLAILVEGKLGGGPQHPSKPVGVSSEIVYVSVWASDVTTEPVQLYDRLPMYSPVEDIRQFRFEFNTSETNRINPIIELWNRNLIVLAGDHLTRESIAADGLLQKPVA